jgi:hypothetical protein
MQIVLVGADRSAGRGSRICRKAISTFCGSQERFGHLLDLAAKVRFQNQRQGGPKSLPSTRSRGLFAARAKGKAPVPYDSAARCRSPRRRCDPSRRQPKSRSNQVPHRRRGRPARSDVRVDSGRRRRADRVRPFDPRSTRQLLSPAPWHLQSNDAYLRLPRREPPIEFTCEVEQFFTTVFEYQSSFWRNTMTYPLDR